MVLFIYGENRKGETPQHASQYNVGAGPQVLPVKIEFDHEKNKQTCGDSQGNQQY